MVPFDELQRLGRLITSHEWVFAKTMPENPHWYTLRKRWRCEDEFVFVVQAIRQHGYKERYSKTWYTMLNLNGMKYWTMGAPLPATILINRKVCDPVPSGYDHIAPLYDRAFSDPMSVEETRQVFAHLGDVSTLKVLDIGCGTGTLLDYCQPAVYTGIDPSHGMLAELKRKHPAFAGRVLACPLEEFAGCDYDLVVCLFGAANYIQPAAVSTIPRLVRPGGRYVIMFFRPGYQPVTYARTGQEVAHFPGVHAPCVGTESALGNFVVIEGTG